MKGLWCCSIQSFSFSLFSSVAGGGIDAESGGGGYLAGHEHVLVGVPEEAKFAERKC